MDEPEPTDVVILGMGPGGEYAAGVLAEAGLHVTGVEERLVGGECPYFGCIPTKMMVRAGNLIAETRRVPGMAGTSTVTPDWSPVALRIREEATDYWDDKVAADRFVGKGGHLVRGRGTITGPGGGVSGVELAQVFARFGTEVTVVEAQPRLLSLEEPESSELIERIFTREGIKVFTRAPAERVSHRDGCFSVHLGGAVLTAD